MVVVLVNVASLITGSLMAIANMSKALTLTLLLVDYLPT